MGKTYILTCLCIIIVSISINYAFAKDLMAAKAKATTERHRKTMRELLGDDVVSACPIKGSYQSCSDDKHGCSSNNLPPNNCCDPKNPYHWFGDVCKCTYTCIDCHGGAVLDQGLAHKCVCADGFEGIDCRQCTAQACPSPQICSREVFLATTKKIYDCDPAPQVAGLFPGHFVVEANFETSPGEVSMVLYENKDTTPVVANCSFTDCHKAYTDGAQQITCKQSRCCTTGWADADVAVMFNAVGLESIITFRPNGNGSIHQTQGCMPIPILFQCEAYGCEYKNQQDIPMSLQEKVGIIVAGSVLVVIAGLILLMLFVSSYKKKQKYLNYGSRKRLMALRWENVSCTLPLNNGNTLKVLRNVSGEAMPGECVAIIGESGAGKTSLLDTIAGRKTIGLLQGEILVNGKERGKDWKRVAAYVMQDDLMDARMTVRETVLFSAKLRLPSVMNDQERDEIVENALKMLGLWGVRNTHIGDHSTKGISGGERKRAAIACQVVANPSLILLDEPTSGLDSMNALRVVKALHHMARKERKTIVFSIHQPDSASFALFDHVHVLANGFMVYSGKRDDMIPWFARFDHRCPPHYNPADFVIHTVTSLSEDKLKEMSAANNERRVNMHSHPRVNEGDDHDDEVDEFDLEYQPRPQDFMYAVNINEDRSEEAGLLNEEESLDLGEHSQTWLMQFVYLSIRSLTGIWRSRLLHLQYIFVVGVGLALGTVYWNLSILTTGVQNRVGVILFVIFLLSVLSITSIDTFYSQRKLFLRERDSGYYSSSAYFVSITLTDTIPLRMGPPILMSAVLYYMTRLHPGFSHFLWFTIVLVVTSFTSTSICLLISVITPSVAVGNLFGILILLFSMLFGGLLVNGTTIPDWLIWLKWLSFFYFSFESLMINEFVDLTIMTSADGYPINGGYILAKLGLNSANFYLDLYLLIAIGLVCFIAAFVLLTQLSEKR